MKGLLYKDWLLIRKMGLQFLIPVVVGIIILYSSDDKLFFMSYTSMVGVLSITSTISYDEYDNGMPMLLSLPYTRQDYVRSKYLLASIAIVILMVFEVSLTSGMATFKNLENFVFKDNFLEILSTLFIVSIMCWIMLPVQFKYGAKKATIAMVVVGGILFSVSMGMVFLVKKYDLIPMAHLQSVINFIANEWNVIFVLIILMVILMGLSYLVSSRIMKKREY